MKIIGSCLKGRRQGFPDGISHDRPDHFLILKGYLILKKDFTPWAIGIFFVEVKVAG
jgi:hypothetical protein